MTLVRDNETFTTEDATIARAFKLNGWIEAEDVKAEEPKPKKAKAKE